MRAAPDRTTSPLVQRFPGGRRGLSRRGAAHACHRPLVADDERRLVVGGGRRPPVADDPPPDRRIEILLDRVGRPQVRLEGRAHPSGRDRLARRRGHAGHRRRVLRFMVDPRDRTVAEPDACLEVGAPVDPHLGRVFAGARRAHFLRRTPGLDDQRAGHADPDFLQSRARRQLGGVVVPRGGRADVQFDAATLLRLRAGLLLVRRAAGPVDALVDLRVGRGCGQRGQRGQHRRLRRAADGHCTTVRSTSATLPPMHENTVRICRSPSPGSYV